MELTTQLENIRDKKSKLDALRPLPQALIKNLHQWFIVEQSYTSNALEGNTLTRSETALVIEKGITVAGKSLKEHLEITNYVIALHFVYDFVAQQRSLITLQDILEIHRLVLKAIDDQHAGVLRRIAVKISGSTATLPDPVKVPDLMNEFVRWLGTTHQNPVMTAAQAHYKLVAIHPFVDGNGRTARLLMNLLLIQAGYPPAIVAVEERKIYLDALAVADTTKNLEPFCAFIAQAVERSLDMYLEAASKTI